MMITLITSPLCIFAPLGIERFGRRPTFLVFDRKRAIINEEQNILRLFLP